MTLNYDRVRGHERVKETLRRAVHGDTVAHAYLFAGPDGVGKELVARTFAAALLCERGGDGPCGTCTPCSRVERGIHPDFMVIEREGQFIKIDRIREVSRVARYAPIEGRCRVVLLREAETLHEAAANALLKTLEEPSSRTVFVLVSSRPHMLLQTILSRCQRLAFQALGRDDIARILEETCDLPASQADAAAGMADGSAAAARALIDASILDRRAEWLEKLRAVPGAPPDRVIPLAEEMAQDKENLRVLLDLTRLWYRDLLLKKVGAPDERLTNRDHAGAIEEMMGRVDTDRLLEQLECIAETENALRRNVSPRMAAERLLLRLSE